MKKDFKRDKSQKRKKMLDDGAYDGRFLTKRVESKKYKKPKYKNYDEEYD